MASNLVWAVLPNVLEKMAEAAMDFMDDNAV